SNNFNIIVTILFFCLQINLNLLTRSISSACQFLFLILQSLPHHPWNRNSYPYYHTFSAFHSDTFSNHLYYNQICHVIQLYLSITVEQKPSVLPLHVYEEDLTLKFETL